MSIPRAPRAPHFPEPSARGHQYNPTGPMQPSSHRIVPAAPGSLSPMAMATARNAVATGPQATMATMDTSGPSRPSAKAGMSILLAGAIIGGLIGAVMHARQNAADAFAAQQMQESMPLPAASAPPLASSVGGVILAPETAEKATKDSTKKDHADGDRAAEKEAKKKGVQKKVTWTAPKSSPKVTDATGDEEAPAPKAKKGKKDEDDGWTVASASDDAPKKAADKAPAEKPAKEDKASSSKKGDKPSTKKGGDDAVNVLKAAMGATENTL